MRNVPGGAPDAASRRYGPIALALAALPALAASTPG
jgi:hypothetical protein